MLVPSLMYCLVAFLVGGIPFGYLVGRAVMGGDIRSHGSGNIGATNVWRVLGWKCGMAVLLLDAFKGLLPTMFSERLLRLGGFQPASWLLVAAGLSAIAGHMFPVWLRFRGGKGVATALGVVLVISPKSSGLALAAFLLVLGLSRMVSLSSIAASLVYGLSHLVFWGAAAWTVPRLPSTLFSLVVPGLIIWRHRSNVVRIMRGTENRLGGGPRPPATPPAAP